MDHRQLVKSHAPVTVADCARACRRHRVGPLARIKTLRKLYLWQTPVTDEGVRALQAAIYKVSAGDTTLPMLISADAEATHQSVVRAMDAAGQMGFVHLSITTRQPASQGGG